MADPLSEPLTLAALWADLARIFGESLPADVVALLDGPRPFRLVSWLYIHIDLLYDISHSLLHLPPGGCDGTR